MITDPPDHASELAKLLREIETAFPSQDDQAVFFSTFLDKTVPRYHSRVFWGDRMLTLDKSAGFMDDPRFLKAYQHIRGSHIYLTMA